MRFVLLLLSFNTFQFGICIGQVHPSNAKQNHSQSPKFKVDSSFIPSEKDRQETIDWILSKFNLYTKANKFKYAEVRLDDKHDYYSMYEVFYNTKEKYEFPDQIQYQEMFEASLFDSITKPVFAIHDCELTITWNSVLTCLYKTWHNQRKVVSVDEKYPINSTYTDLVVDMDRNGANLITTLDVTLNHVTIPLINISLSPTWDHNMSDLNVDYHKIDLEAKSSELANQITILPHESWRHSIQARTPYEADLRYGGFRIALESPLSEIRLNANGQEQEKFNFQFDFDNNKEFNIVERLNKSFEHLRKYYCARSPHSNEKF